MQAKRFNEIIDLSGVETFRRYRFADKHYDIDKPMSLVVSDDGTHVITDAEGKVHRIVNDWLAFEAKGRFEFNVLADDVSKDGGQWRIMHKMTDFVYWYACMQIELRYGPVAKYYVKDSDSHKLVLNDNHIVYIRPLWSTLQKSA